MTIVELINELSKIENQKLEVLLETNEGELHKISYVDDYYEEIVLVAE